MPELLIFLHCMLTENLLADFAWLPECIVTKSEKYVFTGFVPAISLDSVDKHLTHRFRDKMTAISRHERQLLHFDLMVQLAKNPHWFKWWLGVEQATNHYLNQWWPSLLIHIYASFSPSELKNKWNAETDHSFADEILRQILWNVGHLINVYYSFVKSRYQMFSVVRSKFSRWVIKLKDVVNTFPWQRHICVRQDLNTLWIWIISAHRGRAKEMSGN